MQSSTAEFEVLVERDRLVPLRDGLGLATDLYFPARHGQVDGQPRPVVLLRTPYDKAAKVETASWFAERGYVAAIQDVRGRYQSEGEFYPFAHEGPDGYDTVEWLAAQPWCDGKIGTFGQSYEAAVQSALASLAPPHLAAMIPTFGPASYYHASMRQNGALEVRFYTYAFTMAATSREAAADANLKAACDRAVADLWEWVRALPIRPGLSPLAGLPSYERWCLDLLTRVVYDDYWRQPGYGPRPYYDQHADVATLYVGGWYDTYARASCENYVELSRRQSAPVRLLMGPWHHGGVGQPTAGDVDFRPDGGLPHFNAVQLRWFDQYLKGLDTGLEGEPAVRYFLMGGGVGLTARDKLVRHGGEWRTADQWPPAGSREVACYLQPEGSLSQQQPSAPAALTRYQFDPADPVPTIGGQLSAIPIPAGGFDQRNDSRFPFSQGRMPLAARPDVVVFMTEPLTSELVIAGPIRVNLWVATDGPDTDFTAKLIDVYPPGGHYPEGCALNLGDSIGRLRFRHGYEAEELGVPGEVYALSFELYPTANRFAVGHRLRIDISSSNFPRFDVNPNTGGPLGVERRQRVAVNQLYHDASHPSHVVLTVLGEVPAELA